MKSALLMIWLVVGATPAWASGTVTGFVKDAAGVARHGVVVCADACDARLPVVCSSPGIPSCTATDSTPSAITDETGAYKLFINATTFPSLTAFDPFRCSSGSVSGSGVSLTGGMGSPAVPLPDITVSPVSSSSLVATRPGIRNGGFELGDLRCWAATPNDAVLQQVSVPSIPGGLIKPQEGQAMAALNHQGPALGTTVITLRQPIKIPPGVQNLRFGFNLLSSQMLPANLRLRATLTPQAGAPIIKDVPLPVTQNIGTCSFSHPNITATFTPCFRTDWREGAMPISQGFWSSSTTLTLSLEGATFSSLPFVLLIDNIRFATVVVDTKITTGAVADVVRIKQEVRDANEIISQAGINVLTGRILTDADSSALANNALLVIDTQTVPPGYVPPATGTYCQSPRSPELAQLLGLERSTTDINLYVVQSLDTGAAGLAVGPDDNDLRSNYADPNQIPTSSEKVARSGIIVVDQANSYYKKKEILAHEIGHLLIHPDCSQQALEHGVLDGANLMHEPRQPNLSRVNVSPEQSTSIYIGAGTATNPQPSPWLRDLAVAGDITPPAPPTGLRVQ